MRRTTTVAMFLVALGIAAPAGASGAIFAAHSGWQWSDPLPQGETIRAVELQGSLGYAVGDFGTALRTNDGGATWSGLATGVTDDLSHVAIVDGDSVVVAGLCTARRSDDGGVTFTRLAWTPSDARCAAPITGVAFPTPLIGFIVLADGSVRQTSDGGLTWLQTPNLPLAAKPTAIAFPSPSTGIVTSSTGSIYHTDDAGASWTLAYQAPHGLRAVAMLGPLAGYAAGEGATVLRTIDGGKTWVDAGGDSPLTLTSIRCADLLVCLATTDNGDRLLRTTDGGKTFNPIPFTESVLAVAIGTPARALAAGLSGVTMVSDDTGATWSGVGTRLAGRYTRLRGTSGTLAAAAGLSGAVAITADGGHTWQPLRVPTSEDITDASFANRDVGYALDLAGRVFRTRDGGGTWRRVGTRSVRPQAVLARTPGTVLLIGPHGILRSSRRGLVAVTSRAARRAKLFEADPAGKAVVAYGSRRIAMSTNGGRTWRRVARPRHALIGAVDFVTPRTGFLLEQEGRLWKTRNGGRTWRDLPSIGTDNADGLSFSSVRSGYLVVSRFGDDAHGYLLRTTDGGRTWRPQLVASARLDQDGITAHRTAAVALGSDGSLFFTTTAGDVGRPSAVTLSTTRKRLRGRRTIRVSGRVPGAAPGSVVLVSRRFKGESGWDHQAATVGAGGRFTTSWRLTATSTFVAQWAGDATRAGDGSAPLTVRRS